MLFDKNNNFSIILTGRSENEFSDEYFAFRCNN